MQRSGVGITMKEGWYQSSLLILGRRRTEMTQSNKHQYWKKTKSSTIMWMLLRGEWSLFLLVVSNCLWVAKMELWEYLIWMNIGLNTRDYSGRPLERYLKSRYIIRLWLLALMTLISTSSTTKNKIKTWLKNIRGWKNIQHTSLISTFPEIAHIYNQLAELMSCFSGTFKLANNSQEEPRCSRTRGGPPGAAHLDGQCRASGRNMSMEHSFTQLIDQTRT